MDLKQQLPLLLSCTSKLYFALVSEELEAFGITKPQILVLDQIKFAPKTVGEISKAVDLSYSTVSGIIDRLERAQIISRQKDERDRRIVWVSLVDNGEKLKEKIPFMQSNYHEQLFPGISDEEAEKITEALQLINHYLEQKRQMSDAKKQVNTDESS